jgi:hypothetical protein
MDRQTQPNSEADGSIPAASHSTAKPRSLIYFSPFGIQVFVTELATARLQTVLSHINSVHNSMPSCRIAQLSNFSVSTRNEAQSLLGRYSSLGKQTRAFQRILVPSSSVPSNWNTIIPFTLFDLEKKAPASHQRFKDIWPYDRAQCSRRLERSARPLWEPRV